MESQQRIVWNFQPNEVPSASSEHLEFVRRLKGQTALLMMQAYPDAYQPHFSGRPPLKIPLKELERGLESILDDETVRRLRSYEEMLRPLYRQRGFENSFDVLFPLVMGDYDDHKFQYSVKVDARCMSCMQKGRAPNGGFMFGAEYPIGEPVGFDYFADRGWTDLELLVTDEKLASDSRLRAELTPACKNDARHGKDSVFQMALVHRITIVHERTAKHDKHRNGSHSSPPVVRPYSPVFETREKTSFEYWWKMIRFYEGLKEGIPDAFGVRLRMPTEESLALTVKRLIDTSPILWRGAVKPQNFDNILQWMAGNGVVFPNNSHARYQRIFPLIVQPEWRDVRVRSKGVERPATYVEVLYPFGEGEDVLGSNATSVMCFTSFEYGGINGTMNDERNQNPQSRLGYERRRRDTKLDTATVGEWLIGRRVIETSIDPQSREYGRIMVKRRLAEVMRQTQPAQSYHSLPALALPILRSN